MTQRDYYQAQLLFYIIQWLYQFDRYLNLV